MPLICSSRLFFASEADKDQCRKAIVDYKRIRPIVQFGDLYRLQSPYEKKGVASLMYVTDDKEKAVFFWWKTESFCNQHLPRIPMAGLDPQKRYRIIMSPQLSLGFSNGELPAVIIYL